MTDIQFDQVELFKALSNEARLKILYWLKDPTTHFDTTRQGVEEMNEVGVCVSQIRDKLGMNQSTTSQYLATLQRAGLVEATRIGKWTYYKRNEQLIHELANFIGTKL
ncbi:ArsR/SmtB family transcription factor [Paenibacillus sp. Marseille-Q7038]